MQTLYSLTAIDPGDMKKSIQQTGAQILNEKLERSLDLFTTVILYATRIAQYVEQDAHMRASKYLPTAQDLNVNIKLAGNQAVWLVLGNETFKEKLKLSRLEQNIDNEWVKKLYLELVKTPEYEQYISEEGRDLKTETAMFRFIWEGLMEKNEAFLDHMNDELPGWEDDAPMMFMLMDNFFKNIQKVNFLALITGEKQTYANDLLRTVLDKEEYTMELLNPKLVKWESDRVAIIDLILLRMGVCEFLYFPTIPTKVTINEYIDLAKLYSTPQSGQFINGVLDNLLKDLEKDGKIRKAERGMKS